MAAAEQSKVIDHTTLGFIDRGCKQFTPHTVRAAAHTQNYMFGAKSPVTVHNVASSE
jgi:hypothetical protein